VPASVLLNFFMLAPMDKMLRYNVTSLHRQRPASTPNLIQTKPGLTAEGTNRVALQAQLASVSVVCCDLPRLAPRHHIAAHDVRVITSHGRFAIARIMGLSPSERFCCQSITLDGETRRHEAISFFCRHIGIILGLGEV
jgi:hypothetical protein